MVRGHGGGEPSQRQLKVAEEMRHLIAADLMRGEVHGLPGDGASVTVAEVRVSRDLRQATVFATELGGRLSPADAGGARPRGCVAGRPPRAAHASQIRATARVHGG